MHDFITATERLDFTTTGTRPYRGMPIEAQRERYEALRQAAVERLGRRWLLDPSNGPTKTAKSSPPLSEGGAYEGINRSASDFWRTPAYQSIAEELEPEEEPEAADEFNPELPSYDDSDPDILDFYRFPPRPMTPYEG